MPYSTIQSLPANVKAKIKDKTKRRQWLHVWNSEYDKHGDESRAFASAWSVVQKGISMTENFNYFLPISKIDKEKRTVSGYASTPALDFDGEIIAIDAIKKALPGYWEYRNVREMHSNSAVGVGKEANIDAKGLFLTAKIVDEAAWQKCLEGVYKGFSIGGRKLAKTGNTITEIEWIETSIVDRPANPECKFEVQKSAKNAAAFLVKSDRKPFRDPQSRALRKMAQVVETLAKAGPPAAHDGFSLPAGPEKVACKAHGVMYCKKCAKMAAKRDVGTRERQNLASQGNALPGGGFPIKNKNDLDNARQAIGRAKDPNAARALIRRRASELGVQLPDKWKKKFAKGLIAQAEATIDVAQFDLVKSEKVSAAPSFLTLDADDRGGLSIPSVEGEVESSHEFDLGRPGPSRKDGNDFMKLRNNSETGESVEEILMQIYGKGANMTTKEVVPDGLSKAVLDMLKAGKQPSRMQRLQIARGNLKKARGQMKECEAAIKSAHGMHKAAYLAKVSKAAKKPAEPDADDFDHAEAMKMLQKAYGNLTTLKTFVKAANMQLKKAAGRSGQRGQEVSDGDSFYEVPPGIKDLSPGDLATAGPGSTARGSEPPLHSLEARFPGKMAKRGYVSATEAEALVRAAAAEARVDVLEKLPAGPVNGRRPALFDTAKFAGDGTANNRGILGDADIMKGVSINALASNDEEIRKAGVGRLIGNMIVNGKGRNVFDPSFHGTVGG
jgi:hypothetical protein